MLTRRQLFNRGAVGGAGLLALRPPLGTAAPGAAGGTPTLRKWVARLPVPPVLDGRGGARASYRGTGIDVLEVPPRSSGDEDMGLLVGQPVGGHAVPGSNDRRDAAARRRARHVGDRRMAQRPGCGFPAQRPDSHGRRDAGRPGPDHPAPARRREPSAVRRHAVAVVHQRRCDGPALRHQPVHLLQRAAPVDDLVSRPRAGQHAHERLRGSRGGVHHPRRPGTGEPDNPLGLPAGPYELRSCCKTRPSTPTGACSTRPRA